MPLMRTRVYSEPRPRTEILRPSPLTRVIATPGMRCSDSARFRSGNSAMSSALIASTDAGLLALDVERAVQAGAEAGDDDLCRWRRSASLCASLGVRRGGGSAAGAALRPGRRRCHQAKCRRRWRQARSSAHGCAVIAIFSNSPPAGTCAVIVSGLIGGPVLDTLRLVWRWSVRPTPIRHESLRNLH